MTSRTYSSSYVEMVYNSRKTLISYLKNSNYNCDDYDEFSINEISCMVNNNQLDLLLSNGNEKIFVKHHLEKTLRPNIINEMIDDIFNIENILSTKDTLVIVTNDEPNDTLKSIRNYQLEKKFE